MAVWIRFCIIYVMNASAVLALNGLQHCGERLVATMQYNFLGTPKFHVNYHAKNVDPASVVYALV